MDMNYMVALDTFLMEWKAPITLILFINTYLWVGIGHGRSLRLDRTGFALLGAISMMVFGCMTFPEAIRSIDFHTLALVFSLMVISAQLHYSGFYTKVGERLSSFMDRPMLSMFILMMGGAVFSSFFNNTIIALALAPVLVSVALAHKLNPTPFLIALCMCNNGSMTIIGNPQNVFIGENAKLSFLDYTKFAFVPVVACALACFVICWLLGRKHLHLPDNSQAELPEIQHPFSMRGSLKGLIAMLFLILSFVFTDWDHGIVALFVAGIMLCSHTWSSRIILGRVDWQTILLFIGLFVIIGGFDINGLGREMIAMFQNWGVELNDPVTMILAATGLSNMINNTAAVMLLSQVTDLSAHTRTAYALALSNSLTGNLILVGSLSNLIMIQTAEQAGLKISMRKFFRYGFPCTVVSILILIGWFYVTV